MKKLEKKEEKFKQKKKGKKEKKRDVLGNRIQPLLMIGYIILKRCSLSYVLHWRIKFMKSNLNLTN